jgi:hypothetical protein
VGKVMVTKNQISIQLGRFVDLDCLDLLGEVYTVYSYTIGSRIVSGPSQLIEYNSIRFSK